jgi:hypothetical protein
MDLRFRTYCQNPFIPLLNFSRLECSMCLTWSFNSATSSELQPWSCSPWGKTAKWSSSSLEVMEVRRCLRRAAFCSSSSPSSSSGAGSSGGGGASGGVGISVRRVRVNVGLRLRYLPKSGTKREFWTLVRVDRVETSGSNTS